MLFVGLFSLAIHAQKIEFKSETIDYGEIELEQFYVDILLHKL